MINLPHGETLRFVKKSIVKNDNKSVVVSCTFPYKPTLAMICEASAQGTAAFADVDKGVNIGYLVSLKNVEILIDTSELDYFIKIEKSFSFNSMTEYAFELIKNEKTFAKGHLTISLSNESL